MSPAERSAALEGLRGYAAFLVFLVHAFGLLAARLYDVNVETHAILEDGNPFRAALVFFHRSHYGVDLFFVLSGLLMGDLALRRWRGTRDFLWRRWLRIYPTYAAATGLFALVAYAWVRQPTTLDEIAANAFLLQGFFVLGIRAIVPTSWSLTYEAVFYLLVPLLAAAVSSRAPSLRRAAAPLAIAFVLLVAVPALIPNGKAIYFAYFALFVPGVAIGLLDEGDRARFARAIPLPLVALAWIAFTLAMKLQLVWNTGPAYYVASAAACGLVVLKVCGGSGGIGGLLSRPAPLWLGRHSYSFFLIHYIVVQLWGAATAAIVDRTSALAYSAVFLPGALAWSLAAAWLLFLATERFYFRAAR